MTRQQKAALAGTVIGKMGDLLEFWGEGDSLDLIEQGVSYEDARHTMSTWAARLPGDQWDTRLDASKGDEE